jgi:hypothetical protein
MNLKMDWFGMQRESGAVDGSQSHQRLVPMKWKKLFIITIRKIEAALN